MSSRLGRVPGVEHFQSMVKIERPSIPPPFWIGVQRASIGSSTSTMAVFSLRKPEEEAEEDIDYVDAEGCRPPLRLAPAWQRIEGGKNGIRDAMDECPTVEKLIDMLRRRRDPGETTSMKRSQNTVLVCKPLRLPSATE